MKKILFALTVGAALGLTACSLDEYNPAGVSDNKMSANYSSFYATQAYCYNTLYGQLYTKFDFLSTAEGGTDLWFNTYNNGYAAELFAYSGLVPFVNKGWDKAFNQMYTAVGACNTVLSIADDVLSRAENHADDIKTLVAETYFLRGLYHLLLTTYFGPVTLLLEPPTGDASANSPSRNTLSEIYEAITADFKKAAADLGDTPFEGNRQRATRVSALGMLARAYIQGAGQGLTEGGKSYWQLARETAEQVINEYPDRWYDDVAETWADYNNRANSEALFVAAGPDIVNINNSATFGQSYKNANNLAKYSAPKQNDLAAQFKNVDGGSLSSAIDGNNYLYGRTNEQAMAPSKYLIDLFDESWDKRWEYTFITAWGLYTNTDWGVNYNANTIKIDENACEKYGIDEQHIGKKIYPYYDVMIQSYSGVNAGQASIWPAGDMLDKYEEGAAAVHAATLQLKTDFKKAYAIDPTTIDENENRIFMCISKQPMSAEEKAKRAYCVINLDDIFNADYTAYKKNDDVITSAFPSLTKYNWSYYGMDCTDSSKQYRNGDIYILRMAEMYLIAAEAYAHEGNNAKAAEFLNPLRQRAVRNPEQTPESVWKLSTADMNTVFDEYGRELCGEFSRWALFQRHYADGAFDRLSQYNPVAAANYRTYHKWRPISQTFLQLIDNPEEYGDNGYGTTARSGLDGFEQ